MVYRNKRTKRGKSVTYRETDLGGKARNGEAWSESDIAIERAHNVGKFTKDKIRPIVAKFANYQHRSFVFKNKSKLQGSNYRIQEQFNKPFIKSANLRTSFKIQP